MTIRAYINGVEISQIPELVEICALDEWMPPFMKWVSANHPTVEMWAIFDRPPKGNESTALLQELWVGEIPPAKIRMVGEERVTAFSRRDSGRNN